MERGANVLGKASLLGACRLVGWIPGTLPGGDFVGAGIVFALSVFCFFEAYRFYQFFARPEIRDQSYARTRLRRNDTKS
jgi:hypothetical protein